MAEELPVRLPALTDTMQEGELIRWTVSEGDEVRGGQSIAEIVTDKVDMELEAPYAGTITEIVVEAGAVVRVGETVAKLATEEQDLLGGLDFGGDGDEAGTSEAEAAPATAPAPDRDGGDGRRAGAESPFAGVVPAPPPVRKRARELGIDLREVEPTGSRGHVTHADLDRVLKATETAAPPEADERPPAAAVAKETPRREPAERAGRADGRRAAIRKATARSVIRSAAIPQFTLYRRLDLTATDRRRAGRSLTTEIARALAAALWRHPELNATWDEEREEPVPLPGVRIGIAVDSPHGLVVVGVDDPDASTPEAADGDVREAVGRARDGEIRPDDTRNLSSTVSNLGGLGVDRFDALLMPPQATILSLGRAAETPAVVDGRVRPRLAMEVGLTVDHRVADGADGARLLETFAARLEA